LVTNLPVPRSTTVRRPLQDPAPGTLAHGPVTASEIERVRMLMTSAERAIARDAARYWQRELEHTRTQLAALGEQRAN